MALKFGDSAGGAISNKIEYFKLAYPQKFIQTQISQILSTIDSKIESEENKKKALKELFKSMLHNLMTAKIRVNELKIENE